MLSMMLMHILFAILALRDILYRLEQFSLVDVVVFETLLYLNRVINWIIADLLNVGVTILNCSNQAQRMEWTLVLEERIE
jgi:hypothetical protein